MEGELTSGINDDPYGRDSPQNLSIQCIIARMVILRRHYRINIANGSHRMLNIRQGLLRTIYLRSGF